MPQTIEQIAKWENVETFVKTHYEAAKAAEKEFNIPAIVNLAQASLESAWGASPIGNNFHGIKADNYWYAAGRKGFVAGTREVVNGNDVHTRAAFRVYDSASESFHDYAHIIRNGGAYVEGRNALPDLNKFIEGVAKHYATDPNYAAVVKYRVAIIQQTLKNLGLNA
jgi:flagellum-specific peptidoglycan hydrolase FlgJ